MELISRNICLIVLLPFLASALLGLVPFLLPSNLKNFRRLCFSVSLLSLIMPMFISFHFFWEQIMDNAIHRYSWSWVASKDIILQIGYLIDPLTSIMLLLVTTVGVLVMIYSNGYMFHDQEYIRFFCYLTFFTASMLGLVLSPNLIQIYIFWELVGMSSYLLIGFWFTRPSAANACQKAFVTNRIGDFGLLLGILGFYWITGSLEFQSISQQFFQLLGHHRISNTFASVCGILFFLGPIAKSAQFPLHIWLPDAMEGPTPISALIHAATMVAAGIFLVARMLPVFQMLPFVMDIISWVGAITALLGASIAMAQRDLKKTLAYSTMSQLGYMMLALGIGSYEAGLFHLITHAYSKALLFLAAGSVIHSIESVVGYQPKKSQNMNYMGGLRKYMPITAITFLFGTLSLCGIPPFACFWSKDQILVDSWLQSPFLGFIASFTAALTAYYMFRIYLLTFEGEFRGHTDEHWDGFTISIWGGVLMDHEKKEIGDFFLVSETKNLEISYPKESDNTMLFSLISLAIPTLFIGIIGIIGVSSYHEQNQSNYLSHWLHLSINPSKNNYSETFLEFILNAIPSIAIAFFGILVAALSYGVNFLFISKSKEFQIIHTVSRSVSPSFYNWSYHRGYIDELYDYFFIKSSRFVARFFSFIDQWVVDGVVNGVGIMSFFGGESSKHLEGGRISSYLFFLVSCMFLMFLSSLYSYII